MTSIYGESALKPQGLEEKFAFLATSAIWIVVSPTAIYWDRFQDEYAIAAVRTPDKAYLVFQLPRGSGPLVVDAWPADSKLPRCPEQRGSHYNLQQDDFHLV